MAPEIGDKKDCVNCGERQKAEYSRIGTTAQFRKPGDADPEPIPDAFAWVCSECGWEERFSS